MPVIKPNDPDDVVYIGDNALKDDWRVLIFKSVEQRGKRCSDGFFIEPQTGVVRFDKTINTKTAYFYTPFLCSCIKCGNRVRLFQCVRVCLYKKHVFFHWDFFRLPV